MLVKRRVKIDRQLCTLTQLPDHDAERPLLRLIAVEDGIGLRVEEAADGASRILVCSLGVVLGR